MDPHIEAYRNAMWAEIRKALAGCNSMALVQLLATARHIAQQPGVRVADTDEQFSEKAMAYAKPERRGKARQEGAAITQLENLTYGLLRGYEQQQPTTDEAKTE